MRLFAQAIALLHGAQAQGEKDGTEGDTDDQPHQ